MKDSTNFMTITINGHKKKTSMKNYKINTKDIGQG